MITLEQMIRQASSVAEKAMAIHGEVRAHWLVVTRADEHLLVPKPPIPLSKDQMAVLIRELLENMDVVQVVFVDEVWTFLCQGQKQIDDINAWYETHSSLEDFPGRIEAVMFQGEDEDGRLLSGQRVIIRNGRKPMLGPLELHTPVASEGRLTGWLPARGTKQ